MRKPLILFQTLLALLCGWFGAPVLASPSALCDDAASFASARTGVPLSILRAVTLAETGQTTFDRKNFAAWPWAVQADMKGSWFQDENAAVAFAESLTAQGKSNIDVGCFQLNIRWHGDAFQNLAEMIQPKNNALYAANFLQRLYQQTGDWRLAVGQYHSRDATRAEAYLQRLEKLFNTHLAQSAPMAVANQSAQEPEVKHQRFGLNMARGPLLRRSSNMPLIGGAP